jgi:hypothetical protein
VPMTSAMIVFRRAIGLVLALGLLASLPLTASTGAQAAATNDMTPWTLPTRPVKCTTAQVKAGAVATCLVAGYEKPDANGWPTPPFPSDPASDSGIGVVPLDGWKFSGWGYNGSPALADWEATLAANQSAIGPVRTNQLKAFPDALPLFEGFLRDIVAGGYKISDASTYSFRCTSGTGKSCSGLTRDALSNHSWGLAMDMNSATNPEKTYVGIDGASACLTPVVTDIPMWVVRTAEKWGLYWGGYGWSSGCESPSQMKTSATRDATHFEFRGSPEQARAIIVTNLGGSCLDVADSTGVIAPRCLSPGDVPGAGWRVVVDTKAPAGATAALVNLTITGATAAGYVTAEPCTAAPAGARPSSNGNTAIGQTVANLAVVPLDSKGRFCLFRSQPMHTVVDVQGFFAPSSAAGSGGTLYSAVGPQRVIDTRVESFCAPGGGCAEHGPVSAGTEMAVTTPMVPAGAVAVLANLTVTEPDATGYLTADSCTSLAPGPQARSNANFAAGDTVANLAVVPLSASTGGPQFCTYSTARTQKVVDVQGYFAPPSANGWAFTSMPTQRAVDTRGCWTDPAANPPRCAQINDTGAIIRLKAPVGAAAVLVNLTLTESAADGFATALPCSMAHTPPQQSNGNVAKGKTAANLAIVAVDADGTYCIRVSAPMHVVVDLQGTFATGNGLQFVPVTPVRRNDTRSAG